MDVRVREEEQKKNGIKKQGWVRFFCIIATSAFHRELRNEMEIQ